MPKIITEKQLAKFTARREALIEKMPRNYVTVVEFKLGEKYTKNQLRDFKNGKTVNFDILKDLEKIFKNNSK